VPSGSGHPGINAEKSTWIVPSDPMAGLPRLTVDAGVVDPTR
jgi:hypothetical protein